MTPKLIHDAFTVAQHLHVSHGSTEVAMAALYQLVHHYLQHLSVLYSTDMGPFVDLLKAALNSHAKINGIEVKLICSALAGLERGGESLDYMASYPDTVF